MFGGAKTSGQRGEAAGEDLKSSAWRGTVYKIGTSNSAKIRNSGVCGCGSLCAKKDAETCEMECDKVSAHALVKEEKENEMERSK